MLTASRITFADTAGSCCRMNSASSDSLLSKTNDQSTERSPESSIDGVSGDLECRNDGSVESRRMGEKSVHCHTHTPSLWLTAGTILTCSRLDRCREWRDPQAPTVFHQERRKVRVKVRQSSCGNFP
jgi:hypothetical protein